MRKVVEAGSLNVDKAFVDDYARIYSVLLDIDLIRVKLEMLANAISANSNPESGETDWLRFSSILTHYEKKCWFPTDVLLPLAVLAPQEFYHYIRCGYVLKDYGAGVKHGEFTHRLQWHVIMAVATKDFSLPMVSGWDHSPFELYVSLGETENWGIWGLLLDNMGEGAFSYPDSFHEWLLDNAPEKIKGFLVRRETKRREQFVKDILKFIEEQDSTSYFYDVQSFLEQNPSSDPRLSNASFKKFDKWFMDELRVARGNKAPEIYDQLADGHAPEYAKRKTADPKSLTKTPKYRSKAYQPLQMGNVYALSGTPVMNEKEADLRATQSRTKIL